LRRRRRSRGVPDRLNPAALAFGEEEEEEEEEEGGVRVWY